MGALSDESKRIFYLFAQFSELSGRKFARETGKNRERMVDSYFTVTTLETETEKSNFN